MSPSQSRKHRGYKSQRILAEYLASNGWPYALSIGAGTPGSDVTGTPGIDWEIKARRGFNVLAAMRQSAERAADGIVPAVVLRPDGMGESSIARWPFIVPLEVGVVLLRASGYGDELDPFGALLTPPVTRKDYRP